MLRILATFTPQKCRDSGYFTVAISLIMKPKILLVLLMFYVFT